MESNSPAVKIKKDENFQNKCNELDLDQENKKNSSKK